MLNYIIKIIVPLAVTMWAAEMMFFQYSIATGDLLPGDLFSPMIIIYIFMIVACGLYISQQLQKPKQ